MFQLVRQINVKPAAATQVPPCGARPRPVWRYGAAWSNLMLSVSEGPQTDLRFEIGYVGRAFSGSLSTPY